ncbi:MAG: response regulator, partial [Theionarchaea archaeon]|nr:response regulator [Theionarchaea archaeon]
MKVLVMNKGSEILNRARDVLEETGYEMVTVQEAGEALRIVQKEHIDGIISDIFLPGKDGLEICKRIKCDRT